MNNNVIVDTATAPHQIVFDGREELLPPTWLDEGGDGANKIDLLLAQSQGLIMRQNFISHVPAISIYANYPVAAIISAKHQTATTDKEAARRSDRRRSNG